jgi:Phage-related minor tail protein
MMEGIAKGAQLAQISTEEMTRTVAGINQAFGGPETAQQFDRLTRSFFKLTAEAPGGIAFGPQFVTQLPQLAAVSRLARISPAQMYGLYLTTLRTGGSPATAGRGLQYLLQSIAVPASDESRKALKQAGIDPTMVQQQGGYAALKTLIAHAKSLGISGDITAAAKTPDEVLDLLEGATPTEIGQGLGISGKGLDWLSQAIGRIHGVRALVTLIAQSNQAIDRMEADQKMLAQAYSGNEKAQRDFARTWDKFVKQQPLKAAQIAIDGMRRSMIELLERPANFIGRQVSRVGAAAVEHPKWAHRAEAGGMAFLALYGISRAMGRNPLGRAGGFLGRLTGAAGQTWMTQNAIKDAMGPEAGIRGASPQNPLYVTVVRDLFGGGGRGGGDPIIPGAPGKGPGGRGKLPWLLPAGLGASLVGTAAFAAIMSTPNASGIQVPNVDPRRFPRLARVGSDERIGGRDPRLSVYRMFREGRITAPQAEQRLRNVQSQLPRLRQLTEILNRFSPRHPVTVTQIQRQRIQRIHGRANLVLDIRLEKDGKIKTKRVHVPVDMFKNGVYPSNRGNPRTSRKVN